jgi:hypothetical protein
MSSLAEIVTPPDAAPVPVIATDWGEPGALSVKLRVAERVPVALGVNVMETEQFAPAARLVPQVFAEIAKLDEFVPPSAIELMDAAVPPEFVRVTGCAALVDPTVCEPKVKEVGLTETAGPYWPVPLSEMDWGELLALSVKTRLAVRLPLVDGENTIETEHVLPDARVVPQVFAETE